MFAGLTVPTVARFSADGRVFVAEHSGLIKVFDGLTDTTPTVFADLRANVHNAADRGLQGLALAPNFPADPWVYVLYTFGATDGCADPDDCVVSGRLSRLQASGNVMTGSEQVLIEDWCQQYPDQSVGSLAFGADGALYASAGDGASVNAVDYGQLGEPPNPCGDPPVEGGALRSQDLRTASDPTSLDGTLVRVDPATGTGLPDNPLASSFDPNARRIVASGLRDPFRFAARPGTNEMWIGDVGWVSWEESNRVQSPTSRVTNFGWPCFDGAGVHSPYDMANLSICESLYADGSIAVTAPYFAYNHCSACWAAPTPVRRLSGGRCPASPSDCPGATRASITGRSSSPTWPATASGRCRPVPTAFRTPP